MIEKEIKVLLNESEYNMLCELFKPDMVVVQRNNYYMNKISSALNTSIRIREIGDKLLLQVKVPVKTEGALTIKKEYEAEMNDIPETICGDTLFDLTQIEFGEVKYMGRLVTERKMFHPDETIEICMDKNDYLGKTDYEMEIEYTGDYPHEIVELIKSRGISCDKSPKGKYSRFMERKRNL